MNTQNITEQFFAHLVGEWQGMGKASFPTIDTFEYRETLRIEAKDAATLFYDQRTDKRLDDATYVPSHWESGFVRVLENGRIEIANVQSGGRGELLVGELSREDGRFGLSLTSQQLTNDARMVATSRRWVVAAETLTYTQQMHTTAVDQRLPHLEATLHRQTK